MCHGAYRVRKGCVMVRTGCIMVRKGCVMVRKGYVMVRTGYVQGASWCVTIFLLNIINLKKKTFFF